ncbi:hypothetical protein [Sphingomonas sp.]|uniref:hypothetical protein n=1 Tax=Sphingomonas sp. TaxID=28214 RepID=UPI0025EF9BD2|nr:hypothetical protein [Sphingomonas sp.]
MATEFQTARLAALVIADDSPDTPLVLGRSLTELQIARVVSTGARHVVCLVRQISPTMLGVADNLRANGLTVDIVRSIAEAADAVHPNEAVFLIASKVLVSSATLGELRAGGAPALLCVDRDVAPTQFEIVDATMRWTGYALMRGATLRQVANMVGDWDPASTLLRQMVQDNARRIVLTSAQVTEAMMTIRDSDEAINAGRKLLDADTGERDGMGSYWCGRPLGRFCARLAGELGIKSKSIELGAVAAAVLGALVSLTGWLVAGLVILTLAFVGKSAAARLSSALDELGSSGPVLRGTEDIAAIVTVCACAATLASRTGQWGCLLLGGLLIGAQYLVRRRIAPFRHARWTSDPLSDALILLFGFLATVPVVGLFIAAGHAVASMLWLQRPVSKSV